MHRQTGVRPKELEQLVTLPESMTNIWYAFIELHNSRSNGFQANPIAYSEILAYYTLHQTIPDLWEVSTIKRLDSTVLGIFAEQQEKERKQQELKNRR